MLTVPEFDWVVEVLENYVAEVRPRLQPGRHPALWLTERGTRMTVRRLDHVFATVRDLAGLDPNLSLHCLRHSYVTHLLEFGYPEKFVQDQCGHASASTTAIYNGVSDEFRNRLIQRALQRRDPTLWPEGPAQ